MSYVSLSDEETKVIFAGEAATDFAALDASEQEEVITRLLNIQYGFIAFHGLVDENGAADTKLSEADVERLDTLPWRAIKNQTISRSKVGQEPRLYLRVEYEDESFHLGGLTRDLDIDEESSAPVDELRNVREFTLDGTELVSRLGRHADRIARVRVVASDVLDVTVGDEVYTAGDKPSEHGFYDVLREAVDDETVEVVDVYDEAAATMLE